MTKLQNEYWKLKEDERHHKDEEVQHEKDRTAKTVVDVLNWGENLFTGILKAIL